MEESRALFVRRHLVFGWWSLLIFMLLGTGLELLHGYKHPLILDVSNEMRRMMWRLSHAHGALLGLLHLGLAATLVAVPALPRRKLISRCLIAASLLLPGGFFLGGLIVYEQDPWVGVLLAPIGAATLLLAVLLTAMGVSAKAPRED